MKRKLSAMLMSAMMLFPASAFAFKDTGGHWAELAINRLARSQVISGYPDGTFSPNSYITREEAAAMLAKLNMYYMAITPAPFSDTQSSWAKEAIEKLQIRQITSGYEDNTYRPKNNITRAEFATMFFKIIDSQGKINWPEELIFEQKYSDVTQDFWGSVPIAALADLEFISGYPDGTFKPNNPITRAEVSAIMAKLGDFLPGQPEDYNKFENIPRENQLDIDAILKALGAEENYFVSDFDEQSNYLVYIPNYGEEVGLSWDSGKNYSIYINQAKFYENGSQKFTFDELLTNIDEKYMLDEWMKGFLTGYANESGGDASGVEWYSSHFADDNGYVDSTKYRILFRFPNDPETGVFVLDHDGTLLYAGTF